jgi:histidyl-tRNA synthetase
LVEQLGGKPAPACGFAMGVERLVGLLRDAGGETKGAAMDVYLVHQGHAASRLAVRVAEGLRDAGVDVLFHCGGGSFKSQMKKADASGATFAVIIGDDEAAVGEVALKPLRADEAPANKQKRVKVDDLADEIMRCLFDWEES